MQKKAFDKIQHSSVVKTLSKVEIERTHFIIIKTTYDTQPTSDTLGKNYVSLKIRNKTWMSAFNTLNST